MEMSMRRMMTLLAVLTLAGCTEQKDILVTETDPGTVIGTWEASVVGFPIRPTAGGTVNLTIYPSTFKAEGTFTGLLPNTFYHWKTYFGTCTARLAQLGPNANPPAYPFFTTDASGSGTASGLVAGRLRADSAYNVRVFTAAQPNALNDTVVYACGNLQKK
jgi:hypothetical protein